MDIFKDDLLKNGYVQIILGIFAVLGLIIYGINYNSVESLCERHIKSLNSMINVGNNKLSQTALNSVSRSEIERCIKNGGPKN